VIDAHSRFADKRIGVLRTAIAECGYIGLLDDICVLDRCHLHLPAELQSISAQASDGLHVAMLLVIVRLCLMNLFLSEE
jgi:hypothetical protein